MKRHTYQFSYYHLYICHEPICFFFIVKVFFCFLSFFAVFFFFLTTSLHFSLFRLLIFFLFSSLSLESCRELPLKSHQNNFKLLFALSFTISRLAWIYTFPLNLSSLVFGFCEAQVSDFNFCAVFFLFRSLISFEIYRFFDVCEFVVIQLIETYDFGSFCIASAPDFFFFRVYSQFLSDVRFLMY